MELLAACTKNHSGKVGKILNRAGIDVNYIDPMSGETALTTACKHKNIHIVKKLLRIRDINVNQYDAYYYTPITIACYMRDIKMIELILLRDDVNINIGRNILATIWRNTLLFDDDCQILSMLVEYKHSFLDINRPVFPGQTLLHLAYDHNQRDILQYLLTIDGIDIMPDVSKFTAALLVADSNLVIDNDY